MPILMYFISHVRIHSWVCVICCIICCRTIILGTDVVESSVTIPDVDLVIDTCEQKRLRWDPSKKQSLLTLAPRLQVRIEWNPKGSIKRLSSFFGLWDFYHYHRHHHHVGHQDSLAMGMNSISLCGHVLVNGQGGKGKGLAVLCTGAREPR